MPSIDANPPMKPELPGNPGVLDLNRWQPLQFGTFIDQSGNSFTNFTTKFQSPEWGNVLPFALNEADSYDFERGAFKTKVWHDPGPPAIAVQRAVALEHVELMLSHYGRHLGLRNARKHIGWYLETSDRPETLVKAWRRVLCQDDDADRVLSNFARFYDAPNSLALAEAA